MSSTECCPHCNGDLHFDVVARLSEKSRLTMKISPAEGQLLEARTVGGSIIEFANLLRAIGDDLNLNSTVLIEKLTTDETGAVTITVLAARVEKGE